MFRVVFAVPGDGEERYYPALCRDDHDGEYATCTQCSSAAGMYEHTGCAGLDDRVCVRFFPTGKRGTIFQVGTLWDPVSPSTHTTHPPWRCIVRADLQTKGELTPTDQRLDGSLQVKLGDAGRANVTGVESRAAVVRWSLPRVPAASVFTGASVANATVVLQLQGGKPRRIEVAAAATAHKLEVLPARNYTVWVELGYTFSNKHGAVAVSEAVAFRTLEDTPTGPPTGLRVKSKSATAVQLEWAQPNATDRNGRITRYRLEASSSKRGVDAPPNATVVVDVVDVASSASPPGQSSRKKSATVLRVGIFP